MEKIEQGEVRLPFERQERESEKAFTAFQLYLNMGPQRSLEAVAGKLGKSKTLLERWSTRHAWVARVEAQNEYLARVERETTVGLVRAKANEWLARQQKLREAEWDLHEKCIAAARRALTTFLERDKVFANLADIARMVEVASKMGRLASGMATDKTEVSGEDGSPIRLDFALALKKVYGGGAPAANADNEKVIEVEAKPVEAENVVAGVGVSLTDRSN